jgi:hypothetical protein
VFRLPPYDGRHGYGQVLGSYGSSGGHFYIGCFATEYRDTEPSLDQITADSMVLAALSLDALLYRGFWVIVGNAPVADSRHTLAEYKIATAPGKYVVEDAEANVIREATARDVALLLYRQVVAPIRLQHAFEALHGAREWQPAYNELRISSLPH